MLKSFLLEWTKAKPDLHGSTDYTEFIFRGHTIGAASTSLENDKTVVTYVVTDTTKMIERKHSGRFEHVDLAMEIIQALRGDEAHEELDKARIEAQKVGHVKSIIDERIRSLETTNFSDDDLKIIRVLMEDTYCRRNSTYWDEFTMDVLVRYHAELSCREKKGSPINEAKMQKQYLQISRILPTDSELASSGKVYRDNYGNIMVTKGACNQWFLDEHKVEPEIASMRAMYTDIYNRCQTRSKFTHVLMFLAAYYKQKTNLTREMILANVKKIIIRRREQTTHDKMPANGISACDLKPDDFI